RTREPRLPRPVGVLGADDRGGRDGRDRADRAALEDDRTARRRQPHAGARRGARRALRRRRRAARGRRASRGGGGRRRRGHGRRDLDAEPAIKALLDGMLDVREATLAGEKGLTDAERAAAERVSGKLVDKLLRRLAPRLKDGTVTPREILDAFGIETPEEGK